MNEIGRAVLTLLTLSILVLLLNAYRMEVPASDHDHLSCNTSGVIEKFHGLDSDASCPIVRVDQDALLEGNPRKDGIPALDTPVFVSANETAFSDDELIIGLHINGEAKAYPYAILNWHEIVNDSVGGVPVAVTYCPLCETNSVFIRKVDDKETTFGTSGALYNSCLVMYDRLTGSLWVQPWGLGISGTAYNDNLERIPAVRTTLGRWKSLHPDTQVLSTDTGYRREYDRYPYGSFYTDTTILFPARNQEKLNAHPKEISFVAFEKDGGDVFDAFDGESVSVTLAEVRERGRMSTRLGNTPLSFSYDAALDTVRAHDASGKEVPLMAAFAFVIPAFFE